MFWLAEDDCGAAQSAASRSLQSGLDLYLRLRGLQLGAHAKSGGHSSGGVGRGRRVSAWAGFSPIGPRNIRNQLLATTRDEKQQAKHRIPQFFSSLLWDEYVYSEFHYKILNDEDSPNHPPAAAGIHSRRRRRPRLSPLRSRNHALLSCAL